VCRAWRAKIGRALACSWIILYFCCIIKATLVTARQTRSFRRQSHNRGRATKTRPAGKSFSVGRKAEAANVLAWTTDSVCHVTVFLVAALCRG
jgi:hypothetical protein